MKQTERELRYQAERGDKTVDAIEAIRTRRSVRSYTGGTIPKADLETIIDCGRLAATGGNRQPWEFIVVTDRGMIGELKVAAEWMDNAGAIIAVVIDPGTSWWVEDGSAAIENILIAGTALGYGTCWLQGWTAPREDEFKSLLGIPDGKRLMTLIPVGIPADPPTEKEKKPLSDVLRWERYA